MLISNRQDSIKTAVAFMESQITKSFISKSPQFEWSKSERRFVW